MECAATHDTIGTGYAARRWPDPRIATRIDAALGFARAALNMGAGPGSYEPRGRTADAIEPRAVMLAQRAPRLAPSVQARAERLPFADGAFDGALAGEIASGAWVERNAALQVAEELDVGYLLLARKSAVPTR